MSKNLEFEKLLKIFNSGFKSGSQSKLASKLNISTQAISSWINGKTVPSLENINKIAKLFGKKEEEIQKIFSSNADVETSTQKLLEEIAFLKDKIKFLEEQVAFYKEKAKRGKHQ